MAKKAAVRGVGHVKSAFREMMKLYGPPINAASRHALRPILSTAKKNIADDPALSKALTIKRDSRSPKAQPKHVVGPDAKSPTVRRAHFKEFGTDPHEINGWMHPGEPPRPFLTPAYEAHGQEAIQRFGDHLGKGLEKRAAKLGAKQGNPK